jgi:hypothetical protein
MLNTIIIEDEKAARQNLINALMNIIHLNPLNSPA